MANKDVFFNGAVFWASYVNNVNCTIKVSNLIVLKVRKIKVFIQHLSPACLH